VTYIDPVLAEMLRQHLAGRTSGLVFQTRNGTPFQKTTCEGSCIRSWKSRNCRKATSTHSGTDACLFFGRIACRTISSWNGSVIQISRDSNYHALHQGLPAKNGFQLGLVRAEMFPILRKMEKRV